MHTEGAEAPRNSEIAETAEVVENRIIRDIRRKSQQLNQGMVFSVGSMNPLVCRVSI